MGKVSTDWQEPVLSAGIIVVRFREATPFYLLLRAYDYWDFPKGLKEENEEPLAAAVREVEEETCLKDLVFRWGREFRQTEPYRSRVIKMARYYLAESSAGDVHLPVSPELGRPEHNEFRWLKYSEARALLSDRVKPILDWAHSLVTAA
jgi:8-oxo-dGTP pyrophosphatase MutT (NUDIX family)